MKHMPEGWGGGSLIEKNNDLFKREMLFSVFGCNTIALDRLTPDKCDDYYQKASSNCACFEVTSNFQHKLHSQLYESLCNCFPYVSVAMTKCYQNVDTNFEHGFSRLFTYYSIFAQWFLFLIGEDSATAKLIHNFCEYNCEQDKCQMSGEHFVKAELYSRSKLILSSQIRSDILMNLKKRSRSSSQAYLTLIFPSSSQWSDVSLSSWQVHRETKIPLLEGRSTKSFCILLPSF